MILEKCRLPIKKRCISDMDINIQEIYDKETDYSGDWNENECVGYD